MRRSARWTISAVAAALGAASALGADAPAKSTATLRWNNGETIPGELVEGSAVDATWKTPLFDDPLIVNWQVLRRIDRSLPPVAANDPFSIILRNGSHLFGDLISVTEDAVTIRSTRHGEVRLKRSEVLSARRLRGGDVIMTGPAGGTGWGPLADRKTSNDQMQGGRVVSRGMPPGGTIASGPAGALTLPLWNSGTQLEFTLPDQVEVEFRIRSAKRPEFQFAIEGAAKQRLRIETWNEELVLAAGDQFKAIRKLADDEREVAMRVCWDRKTGKCFLFSPAGEPIADWQIPEDAASKTSGLVLRNKGRDLTLDFVRVRKWNGQPPTVIDLNQPRAELADGRIFTGPIVGGADGSLSIPAQAEEPAQSFPLAEINTLIFSADPPRIAESEATLAYADGTVLYGRVSAVDRERVTLAVPFTEEPFAAKLDALRQWLVKVPAPAGADPARSLAELDRLTVQKTTLHGTLTNSGDAWPRWLAIGGVRPATPARKLPLEIRRAFPPNAQPEASPALFYTRIGDVIPGTLQALDRSKVEFESGEVEAKNLPAGDLDAIQFGAVGGANVNGFSDPGWRVLKGDSKSVRRTGPSLAMEAETSLGHPTAMQANDIKFKLTTENFCAVRLRLFCAGDNGSKSASLILMRSGDRVSAGIEGSDGQLDESLQIRATYGKPVTVQLVVQSNAVELLLNDAATQKFPVESSKRGGAGLIIEPASMWGNPVQPIALTDFSAVAELGRAWLPEVNAETRMQTLTVPRFRKDEPPRQVLLAANGDLLRGEIEAISSSHFGFRSGLETLRIPRDRVKAAIWLKKPAPAAPDAAPKSPGSTVLEQRIDLRTSFSSISLSGITSYLERKVPGLKFKLPADADLQKVSVQIGNQTVAEALEVISRRFSAKSRVDAAGTIVLEMIPSVPSDMVEKVYWVKSESFSAAPSAQQALAAKGVPFPTGASARWQPETRQLTVSNTPANHAKLTALFKADFGEVPASPTHWFQLTNGGRLGLEVEKFEPDFVTGRHPTLGRCKLPLGKIVSISTSRPEVPPASKAFADWRLVFSPEPVIQDTGGQNSPLLGKPAKTFKLPLLGGGDFDLAQAKGKIVVLDFWATWCGPCIKSVPALIDSLAALNDDRVKLIGVNQSEPAEQVKQFLETRKWKLTVALDAGQSTGRLYGVDGIPHTVIIGLDGKVAWVKSGTNAGSDTEAADEVKKLLKPN